MADNNDSFSDWAGEKRRKYGNLKGLNITKTLNELWKMAEGFKFARPDDNSFKLRRNCEIKLPIKKEHLWERLIIQSTENAEGSRFYNQFSFAGTNNIDLLQTDENNTIIRLFELKTGSNDLAHAVYEIIFYYFLFLCIKNKFRLADNLDLVVLAPADYCKNTTHFEFLQKVQKALFADGKYLSPHILFMPLPLAGDRSYCDKVTDEIKLQIKKDNKILPAFLQKFYKEFDRTLNNTLTIHRATNEIGGNCIEISSYGTRLIFDFGLPLSSFKENKPSEFYRLPVGGVYKDRKPKVAAVFLTHAHPDHYGLLSELHPDIPIYASQTTVNLLKKVAPLFGRDFSRLHFIALKAGEIKKFNSVIVQALAVDHSVPDALSYKITVGGKNILYTGDLRAHGKCGYLTEKLTRTKEIDYLIMEGTTLSRRTKNAETEENLQKRLEKVLSQNGLPIIYFSAQNLDRFVSVYKATSALGKTLVIDPYTCFVLEQFEHISPTVPRWSWRNIRVYFASNSITENLGKQIYKYKSKRITLEEILSAPEKYVIKDNFAVRRHLLKHTKKLYLIHSAWAGYLDEPNNAFKQDADKYNLPLFKVHTSGHADLEALHMLVQNIKPRVLIPVHTNQAKKYARIFNTATRVLYDGETLPLL